MQMFTGRPSEFVYEIGLPIALKKKQAGQIAVVDARRRKRARRSAWRERRRRARPPSAWQGRWRRRRPPSLRFHRRRGCALRSAVVSRLASLPRIGSATPATLSSSTRKLLPRMAFEPAHCCHGAMREVKPPDTDTACAVRAHGRGQRAGAGRQRNRLLQDLLQAAQRKAAEEGDTPPQRRFEINSPWVIARSVIAAICGPTPANRAISSRHSCRIMVESIPRPEGACAALRCLDRGVDRHGAGDALDEPARVAQRRIACRTESNREACPGASHERRLVDMSCRAPRPWLCQYFVRAGRGNQR